MEQHIKNFFYPGSVCIVGASTKEKSIGFELLNTIKQYGYKGSVYPVNPNTDSVLGFKCYKSVSDIEEKIDLGIVAVPKKFVENSINQLLEKNAKSIILITAGFKEVGIEGEELERKILSVIKKKGASLVGPNCMGVINTLPDTKLNATFVAEEPETGNLAFLSQSGALGAAVLNSLRETNIKFSHFVSVGNKADLNENDFLQFWQTDENVCITSFYLESFEDGFNFVKNFMTGEADKPAIVLKAGKTKSGMKAASSHTGALSSEDKIADALLKQFGIIRAANLNEIFNTAKGFEHFQVPNGNRVAVVTNAGGPAILAVDKLDEEGLALAEFSDNTKLKLREIVNSAGSVENPVDLLPGGTADQYKKAIELAAADENVDSVISIFVEPVMVEAIGVVEAVNSVESAKPVMQVIMPLPEFWEKYRKESESGKPLFRNPEDPAEVISNMLFRSDSANKIEGCKKEYLELLSLDKSKIKSVPGYISQSEAESLACEFNLPVIDSTLVDANELLKMDGINYPVVLKGINKSVIHKSELDAVKINIRDKNELIKCAEEIQAGFSSNNLDVIEYLIQPYIISKHELLLGGYRDKSFGPVIMFGTGGKYVEAYNDSSLISAYASDEDIENMIDSTTIGKIIRGIRGEKSIDINDLKNVIKSCAKMIIQNENILEFDLNPVIVDEDNSLHAVDVRIKVE